MLTLPCYGIGHFTKLAIFINPQRVHVFVQPDISQYVALLH